MKQTAKDVVLGFIRALNTENFEAAANFLAEDMVFDGVMGKRNSAESYISDMKKNEIQIRHSANL
jgi:ketosteroid isomerase-like protein